MTSTVLELAERIKGETVDLENALNRALRAWQLANETAMDQDIYLDSVALTLTLQTYTEEKRARVLQMWLRTGEDRSKSTRPYVRSWPRRAQPQMACCGASIAILAGVGLQC